MPSRSNKFYIVVNPLGSKFAKALQGAIQQQVVGKVVRTRFPKQGRSFTVISNPLNKVKQFNAFTSHNIACPKYTVNSDEVGQLGRTVFARTLINSTNGRGIIEFDTQAGRSPAAPLYTEYIPKKAEYRVHVFNGEVIDVQEKRKRRGFVDERNPKRQRNTRIRNVNNGYVYCRDGLTPPDGIADLAIRAVAAVGYLYGAVDIIYNEHRNQCYVLEVNSRPGLSGKTLQSYSEAVINYVNA